MPGANDLGTMPLFVVWYDRPARLGDLMRVQARKGTRAYIAGMGEVQGFGTVMGSHGIWTGFEELDSGSSQSPMETCV